jgi:ADP-sugar diphosphatase
MDKIMDKTAIAKISFSAVPGIEQDVQDKAIASKPFQDWLASVTDRFVVKGVKFQSVDMFGPRVGFIKFVADVTDTSGKFIPGIVFMRGGAVGMLPVLTCEGKKYTILTVQPRIATGRFDFAEIPAGMLDGSGNFGGVAAKELKEELDITIAQEDLIDLTAFAGMAGGFFVSPGGTEETLRLFAYEQEVTQEELASYEGKCTGLIEEGEQITLKIAELDTLWKVDDGKTVVAWTLYQQYVASKTA